ncbi:MULTISPECIES: arginase [unclassified Vibrio]|uniref:arginase n=1 Tax=unclassified Vibrio TaxID=2614977 RepID=UPI001361745F|nr:MULTISPECIES: arginase [unclassified Vibrio]NAW56225.1 arginase [Vibrio sp. V36_P2S2PM302]NAX19689.1 arginase [Vibrio sp. V39_P1S14PM300]NAX25499.1 arginase [Vibrio sp. V38_P2S17PM301]
MLGLFKRHKPVVMPLASQSGIFLTVCEKIKPMTEVEFETVEQSLELAFEWLYQDPSRSPYLCGGHFSLPQTGVQPFHARLSQYLSQSVLPVILTNTHETVLRSLPAVSLSNRELGIVSINRGFELKQTLEPCRGSAFHFALSRYPDCRLFCLGIDPSRVKSKTFEYAEDQGCDWMTLEECQFRHRFQVKNQLATYLSHCDDLILDVDLESVMTDSGLHGDEHLEVQMVLRMIRQCLMSGKVRLVHLTGKKEKQIFSKQTKLILDEISTMLPTTHCAA